MVGEAFGRIYQDAPFPVEGTASYAGAMVGRDAISAADYAGAARLEVDFAAGGLDATFSEIADIATGEGIDDIVFAAVPIFPDYHTAVAVDLPSAEGTDTYINARFCGSDGAWLDHSFFQTYTGQVTMKVASGSPRRVGLRSQWQ